MELHFNEWSHKRKRNDHYGGTNFNEWGHKRKREEQYRYNEPYGYIDERPRIRYDDLDSPRDNMGHRNFPLQDGYRRDYRGAGRPREVYVNNDMPIQNRQRFYDNVPTDRRDMRVMGVPPIHRDVRDARDVRDVNHIRDVNLVMERREVNPVRDSRDGRDINHARDLHGIRDVRVYSPERFDAPGRHWPVRDIPRHETEPVRGYQSPYPQSSYVHNVAPIQEEPWEIRMTGSYQDERWMKPSRVRKTNDFRDHVHPQGERMGHHNRNQNSYRGHYNNQRDQHQYQKSYHGRQQRDNHKWNRNHDRGPHNKTSNKKPLDKEHEIDTEYSQYHDEDGHYSYSLGESIGSNTDQLRYKLLDVIGEGTFGRVMVCWDRHQNRYVAIKIVRAIAKYTRAARTEINILKRIQESAVRFEKQVEQGLLDPNSTEHCCVKLLAWFEHKNHICMVFNRFGMSLYDFLKLNKHKPFHITVIREIGFQLFKCINYMHNKLKLIHTDLKPENLLFTQPGYNYIRGEKNHKVPKTTEIKLIDFGSATYENEHHCRIISTRHYRAPEVIFKLNWSYPADIWSIGCILVELFQGKATFQTHKNLEHLAMMEKLLGPIPKRLSSRVRSDNTTRKYFKAPKYNILSWPESAENSAAVSRVSNVQSLEKNIPDTDFLNLIKLCLDFDPDRRLTAELALSHPFFNTVKP